MERITFDAEDFRLMELDFPPPRMAGACRIDGRDGNGPLFPWVELELSAPIGEHTYACQFGIYNLPGKPPRLTVELRVSGHDDPLRFSLKASPGSEQWLNLLLHSGSFGVRSDAEQFFEVEEWDESVVRFFLVLAEEYKRRHRLR